MGYGNVSRAAPVPTPKLHAETVDGYDPLAVQTPSFASVKPSKRARARC